MIVNKIYAWARITPEHPAIFWNGNTISYASLARNVEITRRHLARQQLTPGSFAIISISSQLDAWAAMLAARAIGLHALVINTPNQIGRLDLPGEAAIITLADALDPELANEAALNDMRLVTIPLEGLDSRLAADVFASLPDESQLGGYLLLTSGTTGVYKKVLVDCRAEDMRARAINAIYKVNARSVVYLPYLGLWTAGGHNRAIATWYAGGAIVIEDSPDITAPLRARAITDLVLVPPTLELLLRGLPDKYARNDEMGIFIVGSTAPWPLVEEARRRLSARLYSELASTESGTIAVTALTEPQDQIRHTILASRHVDIVDEEDAALPPGQIGMVRIRRRDDDIEGYLDAPAATRNFFRDNYFFPGDLGVIAEDGRLELHGRATDVISIDGNKVATLPIEQKLAHDLGVANVCLLARPNTHGADELHIVVESSEPVPDSAAAHIVNAFPKFSNVQIHVVASLPRNDMGKVQRLVLLNQLSGEAS